MSNFETGQSNGHWFRVLWMLLFFFLVFYALKLVIAVIAIAQFVLILVNDQPNAQLRLFSLKINRYSYQILQFLTFNENRKPFPFSEFPDSD